MFYSARSAISAGDYLLSLAKNLVVVNTERMIATKSRRHKEYFVYHCVNVSSRRFHRRRRGILHFISAKSAGDFFFNYRTSYFFSATIVFPFAVTPCTSIRMVVAGSALKKLTLALPLTSVLINGAQCMVVRSSGMALSLL